MSANQFSRYVLRTTDVPAATAFYDAVLGHHGDAVFLLHEQARARGARPHWLGHVDVADPETAAAPFLARGAERLGIRPDGIVVLRDPGGALLALGGVKAPSTAGVVWHTLRTPDAPRATATYVELFGWSIGARVDLGQLGSFQTFAWREGEPAVGSIAGIEGHPDVHPQWLYFFGVKSVDEAIQAVRAHAGTALAPVTQPDGTRLAVCDDPQGAAFGVMQR